MARSVHLTYLALGRGSILHNLIFLSPFPTARSVPSGLNARQTAAMPCCLREAIFAGADVPQIDKVAPGGGQNPAVRAKRQAAAVARAFECGNFAATGRVPQGDHLVEDAPGGNRVPVRAEREEIVALVNLPPPPTQRRQPTVVRQRGLSAVGQVPNVDGLYLVVSRPRRRQGLAVRAKRQGVRTLGVRFERR